MTLSPREELNEAQARQEMTERCAWIFLSFPVQVLRKSLGARARQEMTEGCAWIFLSFSVRVLRKSLGARARQEMTEGCAWIFLFLDVCTLGHTWGAGASRDDGSMCLDSLSFASGSFCEQHHSKDPKLLGHIV